MLNQAVQAAMNDQIRHEFNSAHFYLSASGYFESTNLSGFAQWMRLQSQEEVVHALKLFDFMHDRGSRALLQAIDEPPHDFSSPLDAFMRALQNEQKVTGLIHDLYALAVREQDYPTQILLQWFVTEQVEEEKSVSKVVEELKMAGDNASALLLLNHELGAHRPRRRARPSGHAG
jgi:ferritin